MSVPWDGPSVTEPRAITSLPGRLAEISLVALAYYAAGRLGLAWQLPGTNASPIWPPSGIAVAAMLLFGSRVWPGVAIGAFLANLMTLPATPATVVAALAIAAGNTVEPLLAWSLIRRVSPSLHPFDSARAALWFFGVAIMTALVAAASGVSVLLLAGVVEPDVFRWAWLTWWVGDAAGIIVLTPAVYAWTRASRAPFTINRLVELAGIGAATLLVGQLVFGEWAHLPFVGSRPYLLTPVLLWTAVRFGLRETSSLAVIASAVAISNTLVAINLVNNGAPPTDTPGPFVNLATTPNEWLVSLQLFVCTSSITGVVLAAALTERQRSEQRLADSEHRFRTIFEHAAIGVALIETRTGRFRRVNQRYCDILGRGMDEIHAATFQSLTHPDDLAADVQAQQRLLHGEIGQYRREKRYIRGDGTFVWVNLIVSPTWNHGEAPDHHIAVIEDITARKQLETRLLEMNATLEARVRERTADLEHVNRQLQDTVQIVNAATDIIYRTDPHGCFTYANHAAERILKKPLAALIGQHYLTLIRPDARDAARSFYARQARDATRDSYYEFPALTDDGEELWLGQHVQLLVDRGQIAGFQGVARDISERKRMESELQVARDQAVDSARLKSEFLANMSHEIRTPMNGVIGLVDLLLDTPLEEQQRSYVDGIRASGESLLTVINDILDFSKIEAGMLAIDRIDFDLPAALDNILQLFEEPARRKRLDLSLTVMPDVPAALQGDAGRLRQVLVNLTGNAIKFTETGAVRIRVSTETSDGPDEIIRFEVQDTGIGISPEVISQLFRPFVQADGSITRQFGGTGLGLVISRRLVELMGGTLGVDSQPGSGSTFWFALPLGRGAPRVTDATVNLLERRVLIVNHNEASRAVLAQYLKECGAYPLDAEDAAHAIGVMRVGIQQRQPVDVVVLDHDLPRVDGMALARTIKADPELRGTRLILLPSSGRRGEGRQAREAGIDAYLPQPIRQAELGACISTLLAQGRSRSGTIAAEPLITRHVLAAAAAPPADRPRILVAEDNPVSQVVTRGQLEKLGYAVDIVGDGHAVLRAVERMQYAAVLMDCQMPGLDGMSATAEIRRREDERDAGPRDSRISGPRTRTPIIALTAHAMQGERERCIAAGMDDYLSKPVKRDDLARVLERFAGPREAANRDSPRPSPAFEIDATTLGEVLQEIGVEEVGVFVETIGAEMGRLVEQLRAGGRGEALTAIERAAHHLSGGSRTLGLTAIGALCAQIEDEARQLTDRDWTRHCAQLAQLRHALQAWWPTAPADPRLSTFWPSA